MMRVSSDRLIGRDEELNGPDRSVLTISADMPAMDVPLDSGPLQESAQRIKELIESEGSSPGKPAGQG